MKQFLKNKGNLAKFKSLIETANIFISKSQQAEIIEELKEQSTIKRKGEKLKILTELIKESSLFFDLKIPGQYEISKQITRNLKLVHYKTGEPLFTSQEDYNNNQRFFFILQGKIGLFSTELNSDQILEKELGYGCILGYQLVQKGNQHLVQQIPLSISLMKFTQDSYIGELPLQLLQKIVQIYQNKSIQQQIESLRHWEIFQHISKSEINDVYNNSFIKNFQRNETVFQEQDSIDHIFFIKEGEFAVYRHFQKEKTPMTDRIPSYQLQIENIKHMHQPQKKIPVVLTILEANQMFGEEDIISEQQSRQFSVKCKSLEGDLLVINSSIIVKLINKYPLVKDLLMTQFESKIKLFYNIQQTLETNFNCYFDYLFENRELTKNIVKNQQLVNKLKTNIPPDHKNSQNSSNQVKNNNNNQDQSNKSFYLQYNNNLYNNSKDSLTPHPINNSNILNLNLSNKNLSNSKMQQIQLNSPKFKKLSIQIQQLTKKKFERQKLIHIENRYLTPTKKKVKENYLNNNTPLIHQSFDQASNYTQQQFFPQNQHQQYINQILKIQNQSHNHSDNSLENILNHIENDKKLNISLEATSNNELKQDYQKLQNNSKKRKHKSNILNDLNNINEKKESLKQFQLNNAFDDSNSMFPLQKSYQKAEMKMHPRKLKFQYLNSSGNQSFQRTMFKILNRVTGKDDQEHSKTPNNFNSNFDINNLDYDLGSAHTQRFTNFQKYNKNIKQIYQENKDKYANIIQTLNQKIKQDYEKESVFSPYLNQNINKIKEIIQNQQQQNEKAQEIQQSSVHEGNQNLQNELINNSVDAFNNQQYQQTPLTSYNDRYLKYNEKINQNNAKSRLNNSGDNGIQFINQYFNKIQQKSQNQSNNLYDELPYIKAQTPIGKYSIQYDKQINFNFPERQKKEKQSFQMNYQNRKLQKEAFMKEINDNLNIFLPKKK